MRIYWFWPYIHADQLVVPASVPRPGDELVVHALRGRVDRDASAGVPITVQADLAPPGDQRERSPAWFANRATTYLQRVFARRRALERGHFDICHVVFANYFTDGIDFRLLARRAALVWEVHDVVPHESRLPEGVERRVLDFFYKAPGAIVVRHEYVRDELVDKFNVARDRITVVPWTVPEVAPPPRTAPHDRRTVLMFGTLRRNKGVSILLEALERLPDLDLNMVFAGRGFPDVEAEIHAAAERDPRIRFESGYVSAERKDQLYREADLVVLP
ncbi:MAG TPA: glycosyltransferase family 4 protein, partial [Acidimicrobiia bacterium]|nr:glycosyltransferase family 4 protein [Acidimicrobiia bacterium]